MPHPIINTLAQAAAPSGNIAVNLLLVLATAGLTIVVLGHFRVATIPGYIIAGAIIGPHALGLVGDSSDVKALSQLSTILLMFTIGLHLDTTRVRTGLVSIVGAAILATLLSVLAGWPLAYPLAGNAPGALTFSMAMACAATAVPLRLLEVRRELHTVFGRLSFGITLFQDLIAVAMLAVLPMLAHWAGSAAAATEQAPAPPAIAAAVARAIGALVALVLLGRYVLPRLLREAGRAGAEVLIVISAAVALGAAVLTASVGFSPELGAFLAGFLLAGTPFRYQIAGQLTPLRDLFLAVFFTTVGLALPLATVIDGWWIVLLGLIGLVAVKVFGIAVASWAMGASTRYSLMAAAILAPAGEFTLVMLAQASGRGILTEQQTGYGIAIVVLSVLIAPLIVHLGAAASRRLERIPDAPWIRSSPLRAPASKQDETLESASAGPAERPPRAIIAGFGPVGRAVADTLERQGVQITIIELNPRTVARQHALGREIIYGDASNPEVMERAGLPQADAVILTVPDEEAVVRACRLIRSLRPDVFIAARLQALSMALQAMQLGADHTVVEEMATAEAMAREVILKLSQRQAGEDIGPRLYQFEA